MQVTGLQRAGYGAASAGDVIVSNLIIVYGLYYLTEVKGMGAIPASDIIFAATMLCTVSIGAAGYISDRYPVRRRKRVPYMMGSVIPMTVCLMLFFDADLISGKGEGIICFLLLTAVLAAHSFYMVPYEAMGADISEDPEVRTSLRSWARWFMGAGNLLGVVAVLPAVELLGKCGLRETASWRFTVIAATLMAAGSMLFTCFCFRGLQEKENVSSETQETLLHRLSGDYLAVCRNKALRIIMYITFLMSFVNVIFNACVVYYMKHNMGIAENAKAFALLLMSVTTILLVPVIAKACRRFGETGVMGGLFVISGGSLMICGVFPPETMTGLGVLIAVFSIGSSAYWQLIYVLLYEACDIGGGRDGNHREGVAVSAFRIVLKAANAVSAQTAGLILAGFGYEPSATVQTDAALQGIRICITGIPGALTIIAALCVFAYRKTVRCERRRSA